MKKAIKIILVIIVLVIGVGAAFVFGGSMQTMKTKEVTIEEGSKSVEIAKVLKKEGIIYSQTGFLIRLKLSDYAGKLQYGTYDIKKGTSLSALFKQLATQGAKKGTVNFTVPEGFTAEQIGDTLEKKGVFTKEEFLAELNKPEDYTYSWISKIKHKKGRKYLLQGYLYPDTYNIYENATPHDVINLMLSNFDQQITKAKIKGKLDRIVTAASVIERETSIDTERPVIAGVIENRLKNNMKLQIDVTVIYPLTDGMFTMKSVKYKDLKVKSPYNTYVVKGLPVGPICNPAIASIKAAAEPDQHEYLYYHTKTKTSRDHNFYKTYKEHMDSQGKDDKK